MNHEKSIKSWQKMYNSLVDPIEREKAKYKADKEKRKENKRRDVGLD